MMLKDPLKDLTMNAGSRKVSVRFRPELVGAMSGNSIGWHLRHPLGRWPSHVSLVRNFYGRWAVNDNQHDERV